MQVTLKESELVVAVRQHLENQGINLAGKDVKIDFSATRGADGIKATIDIEAIDLPALTPNVQPQLRVVAAPTALAAIATTLVPPEPFATAGNAADEAGDALAVAGTVGDEEPVKKSSLFS